MRSIFSRCSHPFVNFGFGHPGYFQRRGNVFIDGERGVVDELLVHHGDVTFSDGRAGDVHPVFDHPAGSGPVKARQ